MECSKLLQLHSHKFQWSTSVRPEDKMSKVCFSICKVTVHNFSSLSFIWHSLWQKDHLQLVLKHFIKCTAATDAVSIQMCEFVDEMIFQKRISFLLCSWISFIPYCQWSECWRVAIKTIPLVSVMNEGSWLMLAAKKPTWILNKSLTLLGSLPLKI